MMRYVLGPARVKGDHMGKLGAFRNLLYALSRIPGLGFLRSSASAAASAERTARNVDAAKKAAGELKGKDEKPKEGAKPEQEKSAE